MQVGQFWYLIASDWWISWNEYVDFQVRKFLTKIISSQIFAYSFNALILSFQGALASGCCTPTYPSGSLKRNSKMQRRVDGSVAQTDDGSSNVVLSSITSVVEDTTPSLTESINSIFSSLSSEGSSLSSRGSDQQGNGSSVIKKSNSLQVIYIFMFHCTYSWKRIQGSHKKSTCL